VTNQLVPARNFAKPWTRALAKAGLMDDLHVHDLRHTGTTLAEAAHRSAN